MSEFLTNLLGRRVVVDAAQGPFQPNSIFSTRVGQRGEIVIVEDDDGDVILGVLWSDGKVFKYPAAFLTIGLLESSRSKEKK